MSNENGWRFGDFMPSVRQPGGLRQVIVDLDRAAAKGHLLDGKQLDKLARWLEDGHGLGNDRVLDLEDEVREPEAEIREPRSEAREAATS